MKACVTVVLLTVVALCATAGAVNFGLDLGSRAVGLWPGYLNGFPQTVRGGVIDLLADVPLSNVSSINFKVGSYIGTNSGKTGDVSPAVSVSGLDARVAYIATAPIVKDAVSAYIGVGATYTYSRYASASGATYNQRVSESGITVGVPAGLKLRLARRVTVGIEMEVPDYGVYHDAIDDRYAGKSTLSWSQYGTLEPNVSAALYLVH